MNANASPKPDKDRSNFEGLADQPDPGLLADLVDFLKHNKKWWLAPILVMLALLGVLIAMASTSWTPFIYTLF